MRTGLRRPPPRRYMRVSDIGIDSASTTSFRPAHRRTDHPFKRPATTTSCRRSSSTTCTTPSSFRLPLRRALGPQYCCQWSTPPLVVGTLRGASSAWPHHQWTSRHCIDMELQLCCPPGSFAALVVFIAVCASTPSPSALVIVSHLGLLHLLRVSPPHLQATTVAALGRWSSYLYMATNVTVQAVGPTTSPSSSSNMSHRQRRHIFLDYTSLFSDNCMLLWQFSLYAVLAP
uniref:Uncharacterized protein n=1 Tax=Oryza meridionalis TaxID=40149 RepID=A0A0E0DKA8_9ORYZ